MINFILWLNIFVCVFAGIITIYRKPYTAANLFLSFSLFFVSVLTYLEIISLSNQGDLFSHRKYSFFLEALVAVSCYFYAKTSFRDNSLIYRGPGFWIATVLAVLLLLYSLFIPVESLIFSPDFIEEKILYLSNQGFGFYLVLMIFLVFGLVQHERTLAALHRLQRWQIKLEIVGSGLLMAAFALYFSHSLLYRSINMSFLAPRSIAIFFAAGFIVYSRLVRGAGAKLALSRGIAYRSFVLFVVGGYLVLLGVVGEGLRYLNINNHKYFLYFFLLFGSLCLAIIFLSETLKRKIKVFLLKNFYQSKYDYREQWGSFAKLLSTEASLTDIQVSILDFLCNIFACKGAAFYLFDAETNTYINSACFRFRRDWRPFGLDDPLVMKLARRDWIINLTENHPDLSGSLIESFNSVGGFLVIPLLFDDDLAGFVVLGEQINRRETLTYEDYDLLRLLARQAIATVQGLRLSDQLSTARELAAIGKVSTFVLHDLKNQVSGLSLMVDNAQEYIDDPEFQEDMLGTVRNTVNSMNGLISRLKNLKEKPQLIVSPVDLKKVVGDAILTSGGQISFSGDSVRLHADEEEVYKVVLNLLLNAMEATAGETPVQVEFGCREEMAYIEVADQGCGMSQEFVESKLFKPFATTKKHGFGIGLYQCKQIIESHQGSISVESREGEGTKFTILLPLAPEL